MNEFKVEFYVRSDIPEMTARDLAEHVAAMVEPSRVWDVIGHVNAFNVAVAR